MFRSVLMLVFLRTSCYTTHTWPCPWFRIPDYNWSRTTFHDERHCRVLTIHRCSGLSWVHSSAKRRRSITTKRVDPRKHQNWTRIGSCNMLLAWSVRSWGRGYVFEQRQYSLLDQNFSWVKQVCHELEQQWNRNSEDQLEDMRWNWMRRNASRSKAKAKPQRRELAGLSTRTIPMEERTWDRCRTRRIFNLRWCSVEEINSSSSSWKTSTSRRWWSDWIQENWRRSSEIFTALSSLVCRAWQEKETRKDTTTVLILQEQSCFSELFKVIQDAVLLILLYRTLLFFRATSSSTFIMSDVQSIYKKYSDNWHSIKNTKDLTMKQMFDISAKLVSEQDEIYGVKTINWLGKFFMEVFVFDWWWTSHRSSAHKGLRLFRFCIVSW